MAKLKSKNTNKNMRNAMIRVSSKNILHADNEKLGLKAGDIVKYSKQDILDTLDDWCKTKLFSYFMIEHNEKEDNTHYHIVIEFRGNSQCKFNTLKTKFPFGLIDSCRFGVHACVRYLIHADHSEKHQYNWSEVVTNNLALLEKYKQPSKYSEQLYVNKLVEQICNGDIREYEIPDKVEPRIYVKYRSTFKNAFELRGKKLLNDPNCSISVYVIQGPPRIGKSSFCKAYAQKYNKSISFSSAMNDAWQDYKGEDIFVLDDFSPVDTKIEDMLKMTDPHVRSTNSSRYNNKLFIGDILFICTNTPIISWFQDKPQILREAFFKRINLVIDFQNYKVKAKYMNAYNNINNRENYDTWEEFVEGSGDCSSLPYVDSEKEFALKDGVSTYTINKIVKFSDITDKKKLDKIKETQFCISDISLNPIDDKVNYFDLKKYIDIEADKSSDEEFIRQIEAL